MNLRKNSGFTMVELLVTMVIFVLVITAASNIFIGLLSNFKQQSKLAESNIEGMVGLKMLKADVEQSGFGLPYDLNGASYANEADNDSKTAHDEQLFNNAPNGVPNAFIVGSGGYNGSDMLVVKSTSLGMNGTTQKWAYMTNVSGTIQVHSWKNLEGTDIVDENLQNGDRVIVIKPVAGTRERLLISGGGNFYTNFPNWINFSPDDDTETYLIYGLASSGTPRMPFNRADYYVRRPASGMPSSCQGASTASANSPGILYKAIVRHDDGKTNEYPLLDCVAAMKVVVVQDADGDLATINDISYSTDGSWPVAATAAADIRKQLKEIRIYILAQEGQKDSGYQSPATMTIRDPDAGDLLTYTIPDKNYRWNIYTLVIKPYNLR